MPCKVMKRIPLPKILISCLMLQVFCTTQWAKSEFCLNMAIKIQLFRNFCLHLHQAESKPYYVWKTALISLTELLVLAVDKDQLSVLLLFNILVAFWETGYRWSSYLASWQPQSGQPFMALCISLTKTTLDHCRQLQSTASYAGTWWYTVTTLLHRAELIKRGPGEGKGSVLVILG